MKSLICPVSADRVSEHIPRINALLVIVLVGVYFVFNTWVIPAFLVVDFFIRGFGQSRYSVLGRLSQSISKQLSLQSPLIDKAPKVFAARLGFVMTLVILILHLMGVVHVSHIVSGVLALFAGAECVFNLCVGCYMYSWFVIPWLKNA